MALIGNCIIRPPRRYTKPEVTFPTYVLLSMKILRHLPREWGIVIGQLATVPFKTAGFHNFTFFEIALSLVDSIYIPTLKNTLSLPAE